MGTPAGPFSTARAGEVEKAEEEVAGRARVMAAARRASERVARGASILLILFEMMYRQE